MINKINRQRRMRELRMDIISELYKRGWSYRQIREEVMARLDLQTYSLRSVHSDIQALLKEWRELRIENLDHAVQLELERIDDVVREAWDAWEKSKQDYERKKAKQQGVLPKSADEDADQEGISTTRIEQQREEIRCYGDPRYLEVIHKNLAERRKLLGLYSPEKRELSADLSFTNLLMQTGIINDEE